MIKKIEIMGIQLDNYTVQEAMEQVDAYLENTVMNTIGSITMETLAQAKEQADLKEGIEALDLAIVTDQEILKAAGVNTPQRLKETTEQQFLHEFLQRMVQESKTVYLFGESREQVEGVERLLQESYKGLSILGGFAMEECGEDYEAAVNEVNSILPDVILSVLPSPGQEYFLKANKEKMSAKIWYGLGSGFGRHRNVLKGLVKKIIHKEMLRSMRSKGEN